MSFRPWLGLLACACGTDIATESDSFPEPAVETVAGRDDLRCDGIDAPTWTVNGVPWEGVALENGQVVPALETVSGGEWSCSDGRRTIRFAVTAGGDNALVIVLDDVGVDKVGVYGSPAAPHTPTLDGLAAAGTRFTRAWAYPICSPSRAALLTGRYAMRTGIGENIENSGGEELDVGEEILPEVLGRAAVPYANGVAGKWHLSAEDPLHPRRSGFDWNIGTLANPSSRTEFIDGAFDYFEWIGNDNGVLAVRTGYLTSDTVDDAIARIADMPEPWVMVVALHAAHAPLHVPPSGLYTTPVDADVRSPAWYDAVLEAADTEIGRLLAAMDPDVRGRTTVVALGDNGTIAEVDEDPTDGQSKGTMFEAGLHVPLIVSSRWVTEPGATVDALVHVTDVMPTVAAVAGVDARGLPRPIDGVSMLPYLGAAAYPPLREFLVSERFHPTVDGERERVSTAIREDRFKLVRHELDDQAGQSLYDLEAPDAEENDLLLGTLTPAARDALERMSAELDRLGASL